MTDFLERLLIGRSGRQTISKYAQGIDRYLGVMTIISAALLGGSLSSPIGFSENFLGLQGQIAIFPSLLTLFKNGMGGPAVLGAVVFGVLPILSISTAFEIWYKHPLQGDKFGKYARRITIFNGLWLLLAAALVGLIYMLNTSEQGRLYMPIYYLLVSVMMQKIILMRLKRMVALVQFVDDDR